MSVNRFVGVGRLVADPELRSTTTGKQVCNFRIAISSKVKDGDSTFLSCSAWGKTAEFVANYLNKGRLVAVDGRLQSRKYTTQDGQQREVVEIVADDVQWLDRPTEQSSNQSQSGVDPFED